MDSDGDYVCDVCGQVVPDDESPHAARECAEVIRNDNEAAFSALGEQVTELEAERDLLKARVEQLEAIAARWSGTVLLQGDGSMIAKQDYSASREAAFNALPLQVTGGTLHNVFIPEKGDSDGE